MKIIFSPRKIYKLLAHLLDTLETSKSSFFNGFKESSFETPGGTELTARIKT
jgi:hypothetical protein